MRRSARFRLEAFKWRWKLNQRFTPAKGRWTAVSSPSLSTLSFEACDANVLRNIPVISYPSESSPKAHRQPEAQAELDKNSIWMKNKHTVHYALFKRLLWKSMKIFREWPISRTRTSASSRSIRKFPGGFRELKSSNIRLQIWEFKSRDRLTIRELKKSLWI